MSGQGLPRRGLIKELLLIHAPPHLTCPYRVVAACWGKPRSPRAVPSSGFCPERYTMFDRCLTFWRMMGGGGFHRTFTSTSGFRGPGARGPATGLILQAPPHGLVFSRRETP